MGFGLTISNLEYLPQNPTSDDFIKIKYHYSFTAQPCTRDSFNYSVSGSLIRINVYYNVGFALSPIAGDDSLTITNLLPDNYTVMVKITDNTNYSSDSAYLPNLMMVKSTTSLSNASDDVFDIYPNPVKGTVFYKGLQGKAQILILDVHGRTIKTLVSNSDQGDIDVSTFVDGLYLIRVEQGGKAINRKMIVIK